MQQPYEEVIVDLDRKITEAREQLDDLAKEQELVEARLLKLENARSSLVQVKDLNLRSYRDMKLVDALVDVFDERRFTPLGVDELSEIVLRRGFQTKAKSFRNNVTVTLNQNSSTDDEDGESHFVKKQEGWILGEWLRNPDSPFYEEARDPNLQIEEEKVPF